MVLNMLFFLFFFLFFPLLPAALQRAEPAFPCSSSAAVESEAAWCDPKWRELPQLARGWGWIRGGSVPWPVLPLLPQSLE